MAKIRVKNNNRKHATRKLPTWEGPEETPWVMKLAKEAEREIKQRKGIITTVEDFIKMNWNLIR